MKRFTINLLNSVKTLFQNVQIFGESTAGTSEAIKSTDGDLHQVDKNQLGYIGANPVWIQGDGVSFYSSAAPLAPHGNFLRTQYIVPANRAARVISITMSMKRVTVETTANKTFMNLQLTPVDGGGVFNTIQIGVPLFGIGDERINDQTLNWPLLATDKLEFETVDVAIGGTVDYTFSAAIIEFDAP